MGSGSEGTLNNIAVIHLIKKGKRRATSCLFHYATLLRAFIATWFARLLSTVSLHESHHLFFSKDAGGPLGVFVDARDTVLAGFDAASLQPVDDV